MIPIRRTKDGKYVENGEEYTPVPSTWAKLGTESGNYGLADAARIRHKGLVLKEGQQPGHLAAMRGYDTDRKEQKGEPEEGPASSGGLGRGRGRGRILNMRLEEQTKMEAMEAAHVPPPESAGSFLKAAKGKGSTKTNGYCLFVKHKARQAGVTGTISDFMRLYDADWKVLPESEKQTWKLRAKTGGRLPSVSSSGGDADAERQRPPPVTRTRNDASTSATSTTTVTTTTAHGESSDEGY